LLDAVELSGRKTAADYCADRRARDDLRGVPLGEQRADHTDVRKAARRSATERKRDGGPGRGMFNGGRAQGPVGSASQEMKHEIRPRTQWSARCAARAIALHRYGEEGSRGMGYAWC
jgi:hypothetical protein